MTTKHLQGFIDTINFFADPWFVLSARYQLEACREPAANVVYWPTEEPDCQWATGWGAFQLVGNNDYHTPVIYGISSIKWAINTFVNN